MYVIVRTMKVKKGYEQEILERFLKPGLIENFKGFVKSELYVDRINREYDLFKQHIYWEDKKAFFVWEGSPEHIAMHKDKNHSHNQKPEYILESSREAYDLIASK